MTPSKTSQAQWSAWTRITPELDAQFTTGAPLTQADLAALSMFYARSLCGVSSTAETRETPTSARTTLWRRSRRSARGWRYLFHWLCFQAAACIVIGLYLMLYLASHGSDWLLP
jgi:hypothetical protein